MAGKAFAFIVVAIALIVALLASFMPQERLTDIVYVTRFFEVMLPILGVGALIKYLCCHWYRKQG